jgi:hypothetical protein
MEVAPLVLALIAFALAWWLGLYLLGRDLANPQLRFAGLGLAAYALGLAADILNQHAPNQEIALVFARWGWPLLFLPALFWFGSLLFLVPDDTPWRRRLRAIAKRWLLPVALLLYLLAGGTELIVTVTPEGFRPAPLYPLFAGAIALLLLEALILLIQSLWRRKHQRPLAIVLVATLFFGLGIGLLLLPLDLLPRWLLALAVGVDLAVLGMVIAFMDAFGQGEALLPDFYHSLAFALFALVLFGGQVVLVMLLGPGPTFAMLVLLLAIVVTAVATQTFADPIQSFLDALVFARIPRVRRIRSDLRQAASAMPRTRETLDPASLSEEQFARLTRRALSQMGNLPRLAANPLTRLSLIEARLNWQDVDDKTLERAAELKALLAESIERLKPRGQGDFGTADEWRHFNALYYPYVAGLKPYSRRANHDDLDATMREALEWFQSQVPERTLHNWQNAAAELVAQDVREQARGVSG